MNELDLKKYLHRIGMAKNPNPDLITLRTIHKSHLLNIPFENLSIHYHEPINLNEKNLFKKIIIDKRGGFCYELNGLFYFLLKELGYQCKMISARVFDDGILGPEFDHLAIIVNLKNKEWLCDVGFGDSFYEPLELTIDKVQLDHGRFFKITVQSNNNFIIYRSDDQIDWQPQYSFTKISRVIKEFEPMCLYHQISPNSHFTQKIVCTKATENGRITITKEKLKITEEKNKKEVPINNEENFKAYLKKYFQIQIK